MKYLKYSLAVALGLFLVFSLVACGSPKTEASSSSSSSSVAPVEDTPTKEPFYALITGNDTRKGTPDISDPTYADGNARTDTMMLCRVDPSSYTISLVTIPRDTLITYKGEKMKFNEPYNHGGITEEVKAVEEILNVKIKYYFNCTFVQFEELVDGMGGVTADVPITMSLDNVVQGGRTYLDAGEQELNGTQALAFARMRKQYSEDIEACRQIQDRQIVQSSIQKVLDNPSQAAAYESVLLASSETNMSKDELSQYVALFTENAANVSFMSGTGPYAVVEPNDEYGDWHCGFDPETWAEVLKVVDAGGDPTTVVSLPEVSAA